MGEMMDSIEFDLPSYWAPYIFNAEESGLTEWDREHMFPELEALAEDGLHIVDVSSDTFFGSYRGMGCDLATYTAMPF